MADTQILRLSDDVTAARAAAEQLFEAVRYELKSSLPKSAEILHIGATAIPGCLTKGDLDIAIRVNSVDFAAVESQLSALFSRNTGSTRTGEFAAFEDSCRTPHLGIQLTIKGGSFDFFHLFVNALRDDPELVRRYNDLKLAYHDQPMAIYRDAKDAFVAEVLQSRAC